jgi:predicted Zn-dependent protease with MMP-like domain
MGKKEFDRILDQVISELPGEVKQILEDLPIIVMDEPSPALLADLGIEERGGSSDLCGLHSGVPLTERSVLSGAELPASIHLFRGPIMRLAGKSDGSLKREIRITLLHEIGHHFGFDEEKLRTLGYA